MFLVESRLAVAWARSTLLCNRFISRQSGCFERILRSRVENSRITVRSSDLSKQWKPILRLLCDEKYRIERKVAAARAQMLSLIVQSRDHLLHTSLLYRLPSFEGTVMEAINN